MTPSAPIPDQPKEVPENIKAIIAKYPFGLSVLPLVIECVKEIISAPDAGQGKQLEDYKIDSEMLKITGFATKAENYAYDKGRDHEQRSIIKFVKKWNGETNSVFGQLLKDKLKSQPSTV